MIAGSTAKFTIVATGDGIKYQWQYKTPTGAGWNTASEGKTDTLSVEVLSYRSGYQYRCKITDANGKVIYSDAATLTVKPVFSITKQPESASVTIGTTATFQIAARGDRIKYQWQYKTPTSSGWHSSTTGNPKTATLSVEATERRDGYQYRCKVTDADGTVIYSDVVTLTVKPALVIIEQPDDVTAIKGDTAKFTVIATGEGLKYQWQYRTSSTGGWSNSSTGNPQTDTLSVEATERRDGYQYRCKVTDADGKVVYSKAATLTVKPALSITKQPVSATVTKGDTAKFTVKATGSDLKYQWQYKSTGSSGWSNSSSGKTNTLTVEALSYRNGYQYRCKITDAEGNTVVSDVVKLTVN